MKASLLLAVLAAGLLALLFGYVIFEGGGRAPRRAGSDAPPAVADVPLSLPGVLSAAHETTGARAAVVIDAATDRVLFEERAFASYPIASLTKLMSALVALDQRPDLDRVATILPTEYTIHGGNLRLRPREQVTVRDLLFASIVGSANNAAFALPRVLGMTDEAFVEEMNRKAITLGLESLRFVDAAGFNPENVGSAYDLARLAAHAVARYPLIADAMRAREHRVVVRGTGREHHIRNTNPLLQELDSSAASKTGYLHEALYCLVLTREGSGGRLVAVLLGHPNEFDVVRAAQGLLDTVSARGAGNSPEP